MPGVRGGRSRRGRKAAGKPSPARTVFPRPPEAAFSPLNLPVSCRSLRLTSCSLRLASHFLLLPSCFSCPFLLFALFAALHLSRFAARLPAFGFCLPLRLTALPGFYPRGPGAPLYSADRRANSSVTPCSLRTSSSCRRSSSAQGDSSSPSR